MSGALADRIGLARAGAWYAVASAAALVAYAWAGSVAGFAVGAILFVTAQAASGSARHALAVVGARDADRTRLRASMHTALNAGFGCGTVLGAAVLASADDATFVAAYALAAVVCLAVAGFTWRLPSPVRPAHRKGASGIWAALRDKPFARAVGLACLVQLTMPALSLLLPVWVLRSAAPVWTAGVALTVNAGLVIVLQRGWAARLVDARATAWSACIAAAGIVVAGALLATVPHTDSASAATAVTLAAVVAFTIGEIAGGAAIWCVALQGIPSWAEGRYQAAFSMSASGARLIGPLLALPLIVHAGPAGWILLTVAMSAACLAIARRARLDRGEQAGPRHS